MRVIVWGINYAPELTGIGPFNTALCEFLAANGHEVEMVASFSYYPEWKTRSEDKGLIYRTDKSKGVVVRRNWLFVPRKVAAFSRILHEASFVVMSLLRVLSLRRPDLFVVISPPLLLGVAAWVAGMVKQAPFVFHVQDLQPDAAVGLGMIRRGVMTRMLFAVEGFAYKRAARISGIGGGMMARLREKGVPEAKLVLFPNGVRLSESPALRGKFRESWGIDANCFLAVYSGNLGVKQGLDVLIEAAVLLQRECHRGSGARSIKIVIAGDGARRGALAAAVEAAALVNVLLLPLQPEFQYEQMLSDADCTVITQYHGTGDFFVPSKLLSCLAAAKPVLTVSDDSSELAKAVREGEFGVNVAPDRPELLVEALRALANSDRRVL